MRLIPRRSRIFKLVLTAILLWLAVAYTGFLFLQYRGRSALVTAIKPVAYSVGASAQISAQELVLAPGAQSAKLEGDYELVSQKLPAYIKFEEGVIKTSGGKYDLGNFRMVFKDKADPLQKRLIVNLSIKLADVDTKALQVELAQLMGANADNMGYYIEDYLRGVKITHHPAKQFKPGSISKLPVGLVVIRDLDSGKRQLSDTFMIYNKHKHSSSDAIGRLPQGSKVTIKQLIEELFRTSNNSAQYHLRELIGNPTQDPKIWSSGVLNDRVKQELGVSEWGEDPHIATPNDVGKVWGDIYRGKLLSQQWKDYFLNTLGSAAPSLREALPAGLPKGIRIVNKVGFLYGGQDNTYSDTGLVFGNKTDYSVVIFNNNAPRFPTGSQVIKQMSGVIYRYLDQ